MTADRAPRSLRRRDVLRAGVVFGAASAAAGLSATRAWAAATDRVYPAAGTRIQPASIMPIEDSDTPETIIAKAANIVPRPAQVTWQERELTAFTHFGMDTFTDREWGSGAEDEASFAPSRVDIDQWMRVYKAAGFRQVMLTAKHHDGFVLYPTRYTNHSVIASPWWIHPDPDNRGAGTARARASAARTSDPSAFWQVRHVGHTNPEGDILGTYLRAARRAGLKVGVYLSPADGAELPYAWHAQWVRKIVAKHDAGKPLSIEEQATYDDRDRSPAGMGRYGNGSPVTARTIPTLVDHDDRSGAVASGRMPHFQVHVDDYNAYYLNQLYELFTEYGPIDELWLDGANPWSSSGISETYDFTTWFEIIHELSPHTVVFAGPQGTRWVGNENGVARVSEWSVTPATADPATAHGEGLLPDGPQATDIGSRAKITAPGVKYLQWFPAEADMSIRPGWFWHAGEEPRTAVQLVDRYEKSVGRNAVLLLNVPPSTAGRIEDADVASLTAFAEAVTGTYSHNLLTGARPARLARALTSGRLQTAWSPADDDTTGAVELDLPRTVTFDRIRLGEDIRHGQRVEAFEVSSWDGTNWAPIATGTTIGYARILATPHPVRTQRIRVSIQQARATPHLATLGLYQTVSPG